MTTTMEIAGYYDRREAMGEAVRRWCAGNDAGDGYPDDGDGVTILEAQTTDEVEVRRLADGREIAVGDAHGAWAVVITPHDARRHAGGL